MYDSVVFQVKNENTSRAKCWGWVLGWGGQKIGRIKKVDDSADGVPTVYAPKYNGRNGRK